MKFSGRYGRPREKCKTKTKRTGGQREAVLRGYDQLYKDVLGNHFRTNLSCRFQTNEYLHLNTACFDGCCLTRCHTLLLILKNTDCYARFYGVKGTHYCFEYEMTASNVNIAVGQGSIILR